jgi:phosphate transport system permease protein
MSRPDDSQPPAGFPVDAARQARQAGRQRAARAWQLVFLAATTIGILGLAALLYNVVNDTAGLVAFEYKVDPRTLAAEPLEDLSPEALIAILEDNLRRREIAQLNAELPLAERTQAELYQLVVEKVLEAQILGTWPLTESLLRRAQIVSQVQAANPGAELVFRSWLNPRFLQATMSSRADLAGVRTALLGSLWMIGLTILIAFPIGVGAAVYLEEYAGRSRLNRLIQINIDNLAGVPSIVYGILGLAVFVRAMERYTSGAALGVTETNGRTILSAALTMALLILPILIINAQEAIRAVPRSLRLASYGLGATRWQTIWHHVLPSALPGILTGTILAISRAVGETAPLIVIGASTYITADPSGPFSKFTVLPIQIYSWTTRAQGEFHNLAAAAIVVLLVLLLSLNAIAVLLRNRFSRRLT